MVFKAKGWVEHPKFGIGRVREDRGDRYDIHFTQSGIKTLLKTADLKAASSPSPNFEFPTDKGRTRASRFKVERPSRRPPLDFDHLVSVFKGYYPGDFEGERFNGGERQYKEEAVKILNTDLSKSVFEELLRCEKYAEICNIAKRVLQKTNLVYPIEKAKFKSAVFDIPANHERFSKGLFELLHSSGEMESRFINFCGLLADMHVAMWTVATYYQFLASDGKWMFMKSKSMNRMADSLNISLNYKPEPNWLTYSKLQELADRVELELQNRGLKPRSRVDVQGFIWASITIEEGKAKSRKATKKATA